MSYVAYSINFFSKVNEKVIFFIGGLIELDLIPTSRISKSPT